MLYNKILENPLYLSVMKEIDSIKFISDGKWDFEHGLGHAIRFSKYVMLILSKLNADDRTIEVGMCASLLHDVGLSKGKKENHAVISSEMFTNFIDVEEFSSEEIKIMRQAIKDHSRGEYIESEIGLAILLADKLDVTYHRAEHSSIQDHINTEIQKIRRVDIDITETHLIVNYETVGDFDLDIFMYWKKAITVPAKVATYLNKSYVFQINGLKRDVSKFFDTNKKLQLP